MSLLEVITKAASNLKDASSQSEYPIVLNPDDVFVNLKPRLQDQTNDALLVSPVSGWELSETDTNLIDLSKKFYTKLNRKLKDTNSFNKDEFIEMFKPFLEKINKVGSSAAVDSSSVCALLRKVGVLMGRDLAVLVLEACLKFEIWDMVETMISGKIVDHSCYSSLVESLISKNRSELLCSCIKHAADLGLSELLGILKYFLSPSRDAYNTMSYVRRDWESQALVAIEKASDNTLSDKKSRLAKDAAILLMIAHDGFTTSELCLHYLLASSNIDEVVMLSAVSKLNGREMMNLVRYLGKWLNKYERFPQAVPCPEASSKLGLKACDWVPKLEDIARCLGLVIDGNFSTLVLRSEFREELIAIKGLAGSLASEAVRCSTVANVVDRLRSEAKGEQN
ncbi:hypothetical protein LINPERHAP2_LOCUS34493 [Linum perenne]